ncbi:ABC transporter permease [Christensenella minuta]|uniref:ABC transporter permease n=1 Tax=Christensenella minuta TaxID=626937 RepID=UPI002A7ED7DA|nr:FtsX-like permease family protein [Christensenella minuta]MDY3750917.1 FtsX-like permease family protein [Christensenella minuta]
MNPFQRAVKYIGRKKVRTIILFCILFAMALSMLICSSIRGSAVFAAEEVRKTYGSGFRLYIDFDLPEEMLWEDAVHEDGMPYKKFIGPNITPEALDELLAVTGIEEYCSGEGALALYTSLELVPGLCAFWYDEILGEGNHYPEYISEESYWKQAQLYRETPYPEEEIPGIYTWRNYTNIYFCENSGLHPFFRNGSLTLAEGRHIGRNDAFCALVSETLAGRNGLSLGDSFTVEQRQDTVILSGDPETCVGRPIPLTVVGIFRVNFADEPSRFTMENELTDNFIFTDMQTDEKWREYYSAAVGKTYTPGQRKYNDLTLFVEDPALLDDAIQKVRSLDLIDWNYYTIEKDDSAYRALAKPLDMMTGITTFLTVLLAAGCLIVLMLLFFMWIRGRRREIGILRAQGVRKGNILCQLLLECLLVAAAAFCSAALVAAPLSQPLGDLLAGSVVDEAAGPFEKTFDRFQNVVLERVSSEPVTLLYPVEGGGLAAVGILLLSVSSGTVCIAAAPILRQKPRDILSGK